VSYIKFLFFLFVTPLVWGNVDHVDHVDSVGEPNTTWSNSTVRVCWGDIEHLADIDIESSRLDSEASTFTNWKYETKNVVKKVIEKNYVKSKVGIEFTDWSICPPSKSLSLRNNYDLIIFGAAPSFFNSIPWYFDNPSGLLGKATIGNNGILEQIEYTLMVKKFKTGFFKQNKKKKSFVFLRTLETKFQPNLLNRLELTALHEFGHAAGLRHEFSRQESQHDPFCKLMAKTYSGYEIPKEPLLDSATMYSDYDPFSVMSYCYLKAVGDKHSTKYKNIETAYSQKAGNNLSTGDVKTLRCLYKLDVCLDHSLDYRKKYVDLNF